MLIRFRYLGLLLYAVLLGLSVWSLPGLRFDLSIVPLLQSSKSARAELDDFHDQLPRRPFVLGCVLEWPEAIESKDLETVAEVHRRIAELPSARFVYSLKSVRVLPKGAAIPVPVPLRRLARAKPLPRLLDDHPMLRGYLISEDGRSTCLYVAHRGGRRTLLKDLEGIRDTLAPSPVRVRLIGAEVIERAMNRSLIHDLVQSLLLETIGFLIVLPILFRSLRGLVVPVAVVNSAVLLNFGLMILRDEPLTIIGVATPGLIAVIALCDAIHMLHRFEESYALGESKHEAILTMMKGTGKACFLTSLTTSIGFLSLALARHEAVESFAINAAVGVMLAFLAVVTLLPFYRGGGAGRKLGSGGGALSPQPPELRAPLVDLCGLARHRGVLGVGYRAYAH